MPSKSFIKNSFNQLFSFVLLASILSSAFPATAQTRRKPSPAPKINQPVAAQKAGCLGGWSGIVTYKKILKDSFESDEPGIRKSIDRVKHKTSRDYDYTRRAILDGKNPKNTVVNTKVNFTNDDLNSGEDRVFDTCGATEKGHWFVIENRDDRQTDAKATGSAQSFSLQLDEMSGEYRFSLQFPDA